MSGDESSEDGTYVAKSNSLANNPILSRTRPVSYCEDGSQTAVKSISEKETISESSSGVTMPGNCPQTGGQNPSEPCDTESGYNTSSSVSNNKTYQSSVVEKDSNNSMLEDLSNKRKIRTESKTAVAKRTQSQRRPADSPSTLRTVTGSRSPQTKRALPQRGSTTQSASNSPTPRRTKPRILSNGGGSNTRQTEVKSRSVSSSRTSGTASTPIRTSTVARTPSTGRQLSSGRSSKVSQMRRKSLSLQRPKSMFEIGSTPPAAEAQEPLKTERELDSTLMSTEVSGSSGQVEGPANALLLQTNRMLSVTPEMDEDEGFNSERLLNMPRQSATTVEPELSGSASSKPLSPSAELSSNGESAHSSLTCEPPDEQSSSSSSKSQTLLSPTIEYSLLDQSTSTNSERGLDEATSIPKDNVSNCGHSPEKPDNSFDDHSTDQSQDSEPRVEFISGQATPSTPNAKKPKHTVAYAQTSPLFKDGETSSFLLLGAGLVVMYV